METSFAKNKMKIVLLESVHASGVDAFRADGHTDIEYHEKSLPEPQLIDAAREAYVLGIRSGTQLTRGVFENAPRLIAVGCFCIGTNQVDLDAAQDHGVAVFNAPFSNTRSVAELVLAEIVFLMRGIPQRNAATHRGEWLKNAAGSREARGKTLGIVGYGHIGTQIGVLAESLGMNVLFYDIEMKLAMGNARQVPSLEELLEASDVVTLHVPQTQQTHNMIGAAALARMKKGAGLINAARGTVVDIGALAEALASRHLGGAAIDVFPSEPQGNGEEFVSPLRNMDNVILTPHIGGSTQEAQRDIGIEVSGKLLKYSNNGSTLGAVNFPEVSLPAHPGQHRLLHIHRNQPGVMSQINAIFSQRHINIAGQYLQTNPKIGYVVIDIETSERALSQQLKKRLEQVEGTIRTRVLY
ncbi:MAG TPA: phosphoglycerate dehydrogenase [Bryobacteraceae bacterium]|nr:phosphoglycerate dehydrogenase [Bryobacteraceae bacterium]